MCGGVWGRSRRGDEWGGEGRGVYILFVASGPAGRSIVD